VGKLAAGVLEALGNESMETTLEDIVYVLFVQLPSTVVVTVQIDPPNSENMSTQVAGFVGKGVKCVLNLEVNVDVLGLTTAVSSYRSQVRIIAIVLPCCSRTYRKAMCRKQK